MEDLRSRPGVFNLTSRDHRDAFAHHWRNLSALLGAGDARGRTRRCVLGPANANDLDLPALLEAHREIHLVDLDDEALARGAGRQGVAGHPAHSLHGGLDVTGMLDALASWTPWSSTTTAELSALARWPAGRVAPALTGGFDVVASTCPLIQLMETARHVLGACHPRLGAVDRTIRAGHLRLLARLASPGAGPASSPRPCPRRRSPSWRSPRCPRCPTSCRGWHGSRTTSAAYTRRSWWRSCETTARRIPR